MAVGISYGGLHAVLILLAVATVRLSLLMRRSRDGSRIAWLGFFAAACDLIGAYPYAVGPTLTLVCQRRFAGWFVAVGAELFRM